MYRFNHLLRNKANHLLRNKAWSNKEKKNTSWFIFIHVVLAILLLEEETTKSKIYD